MNRAMNTKAFAWSSALAFVFVTPGLLVLYELVDTPWPDRLGFGLVFLAPGAIPALLLALFGAVGNVHDPSPAIMVSVSFFFWWFALYKTACWIEKRRGQING